MVDAVPYKIYLHHNERDRNQYPVLIIPRDGLPETFWEELNFVPSCYDVSEGYIRGWAPGYEDGGTLVAKREFPVVYFDDERYVQLQLQHCILGY
jgi:hypothetical protein